MKTLNPTACQCCENVPEDGTLTETTVREVDHAERTDSEMKANLCAECISRLGRLFPVRLNSVGAVCEWSVA